ncbi:hypothetical protein AB0C93_12800 [Streptomyces sp. NPDC048518]|uniref:hypothetical protein n=1 Tax=Streptomyces sp. NPDC048518 TaxID=3155029 RepID=UPI0033C8B3D5
MTDAYALPRAVRILDRAASADPRQARAAAFVRPGAGAPVRGRRPDLDETAG